MANLFTRRHAVTIVGGGLLASLRASGATIAQHPLPHTDEERANLDVVDGFIKAWSAAEPDSGLIGQFLTEDCVVKLPKISEIRGKHAAMENFQSHLDTGIRFSMEILESFFRGPVVTHHRRDNIRRNGKEYGFTLSTGVFLLQDGKIRGWAEYLIQKETIGR